MMNSENTTSSQESSSSINPCSGAISAAATGTLAGLAAKWAGNNMTVKEAAYTNAAGGAIAGVASSVGFAAGACVLGASGAALGAGLNGEEGAAIGAVAGVAISGVASIAAMPAIRAATAKAIFPEAYENVNAITEAYKGAGIVAGLAIAGVAATAGVAAACYGTGIAASKATESFASMELTRRGQRDKKPTLPR